MGWSPGTSGTIAVGESGNTTLATIRVPESAETFACEVAVSNNYNLDAFIVSAMTTSAGGYVTLANAAAHFSTVSRPCRGTMDLTIATKNTSQMLWVEVSGLYQLKIEASTATGAGTVTLNWAWR